MPRPEFEGVVGRTYAESEGWWPPLPSAPEGAPNVVIVLLDDVGYAQLGCYGSDIATPCFDRLAGRRAPLLELPHHGALLADAGVPAHRPQPPLERHGPHRRVRGGLPGLQRDHPARERLPLGDPGAQRVRHLRGRQVAPHARHRDDDGQPARQVAARPRVRALLRVHGRRDRPVPPRARLRQPPRRAAGDARRRGTTSPRTWPTRRRCSSATCAATQPDKPFFLWFTPGACHAPHQAPASFIEPYRGQFDQGWDAWRDEVFARQVASGLLPAGTRLSERPVVGAGVGLAQRGRAAPLRPDDGGLRRLPHPHRRPGAARARRHRRAGRARRHDRHRDERQRRQRRGRREGARSTSSTSSTSCPRAWRRTCAASTTSAPPAPTTTTRGAGPGRATRRSSASSATPTREASPTRSSSTGPSGSGRAARATSTCTPST